MTGTIILDHILFFHTEYSDFSYKTIQTKKGPFPMHQYLSPRCRKTAIFFFWLSFWQLTALLIDNSILMAGPWEVIQAFFHLMPEKSFWLSIAVSFGKISAGFLLAFFSGILIGWLAFLHPVFGEFLAPVISFMKSVPVASFVILALIWMGSERLSSLITFLVVFPVIYVNTIAGLKSTDKELLEMAQVFSIRGWRKGRCLYWPALLPYLNSSCKTALGMSWKSGIAAEVIGVPEQTIGEQLYLSKIYLNTAELFAWTLVIILVSAGFERLFLVVLNRVGKKKPVFLGSRESNFQTHTGQAEGNFLQTSNSLTAKLSKPHHCHAFTLSIHHLSKHFGTLEIFNRQDFSFSSEKPWCIMAASGFGKTTLFRILLGLEKAEEGEIEISNTSCEKNKITLNLLKENNNLSNPLSELRISAVFQENRLCETLSPVDNLLLAVPELNRKIAEQELSLLLPAECLNRPVSTLSGGMKRRAALVRAVCFSGTILLMDEPFTGLDEDTKQDAARYILSRRQGRLFIFSSHQEEEGRLLEAEILHLSSARLSS